MITAGQPPGLTTTSVGAGGTLNGTPTTDGTYNVGIAAIDGFGNVLETTLPLTVDPGIAQPTLPIGAVGSSYSSPTLTALGAAGSTTWAATGCPQV